MDQFFWPIFGTVFILILLAMSLIGAQLSASRKLKLRQIEKEERVKAMEAGVPLPEVAQIGASEVFNADHEAGFQRQVQWFRLLSLAVGLFLVFTGAGMGLAFKLSGDADLNDLASIGAMPMFAGFGLLLFWFLSKRATEK